MDWSSCIVVLIILHFSASKDCVELNPRSLDSQWEIKLYKDLDKCYEVMVPPSNKTIVYIKILIIYFTIDNTDGSLFMYSWTTIKWQDERLKWNPKDYYGITETYFWSFDYWAWVPIVVQKNIAEQYDFPDGKCKIRDTGQVVCRLRMKNTARCTTFMRNWPYEKQNCTLEYGINYQKGVTLLPLDRFNRTVSFGNAVVGAEWIISDYNEVYTPDDSVQIRITFTLERNADGLKVIIFPSVLLAILAITTLFKDVEKSSRFWLTCYAVMCHFLFLSTISSNLPSYGTDIPTIVMFHRSSLFLSSVLVMVTFGLKSLRNRETVPPSWIRSVNCLVFKSYGKYMIWPRWETKKGRDGLTSDSVNFEDLETWNDFGNIVNTLCWVICAMIYLIIYFVYMPQPPTTIFKF